MEVFTPANAAPLPPRQLSGLDSLAAVAEGAAMAENPTAWIHETPVKDQGDEDDASSVQHDQFTKTPQPEPSTNFTVVHSRKNANGPIGSVYSGNKIKHLKKEDGVPLWRRDIQYAFLRAVFEDATPVFTSCEDGTKGHSFADIYISAMAKSSKCSKVLRDKLLSDRESALNMAMICLLVNVGRMNTTLNFFPEMRAQLRTYHAIPCLQAHIDPNAAYKGLQDAPRLKSILKGACEDDKHQPNSIESIVRAEVGKRGNPVNLIFVLSNFAAKISELHFYQPRDFFDLIIKSTLSSKSRARAFLWLLWYYLESDFSDQAALNNPFGPGEHQDDSDGRPIKVPQFEYITDDEAAAENEDTPEEESYGRKMRDQRKKILKDDEEFGSATKKPAGRLGSPKLRDEFADSPARSPGTRSPSPSQLHPLNMPKPRASDGHASGKRPLGRISLKLGKDRNVPSSSPAPPGTGHATFSIQNNTPHSRRNRQETTHQRAVHMNKTMRINKMLHDKMRIDQRMIKRRNRDRTRTSTFLALDRIMQALDDYDSEDEGSHGPGGLVPDPSEEDDFGAEAAKWKRIINRTMRRVDRTGTVGGLAGLAGLAAKMNSRKRKLDEDATASPVHDPNCTRIEADFGQNEAPLYDRRELNVLDKELLGEDDLTDGSESEDLTEDGWDDNPVTG